MISIAAIDRNRRAAAAGTGNVAAGSVGARERITLFAQVAALAAELGRAR